MANTYKNKTILIVEDDFPSYILLERYLKGTDATIVHVTLGQEAVDYCKNEKNIDMVLMDINLPDINGYEATKAIKLMRENLPIISQTANAMDGDCQKSLLAGCNAYISKPLKRNDLLQLIDEHMR